MFHLVVLACTSGMESSVPSLKTAAYKNDASFYDMGIKNFRHRGDEVCHCGCSNSTTNTFVAWSYPVWLYAASCHHHVHVDRTHTYIHHTYVHIYGHTILRARHVECNKYIQLYYMHASRSFAPISCICIPIPDMYV